MAATFGPPGRAFSRLQTTSFCLNDMFAYAGEDDGRTTVRNRGFLRQFRDNGTGSEFVGFYVNTNKTADRFKDVDARGYEIPWQHDEVIKLVSDLAVWQTKYNPLKAPTKWADVTWSNTFPTKSV
jgi:hypothetical protein